MEENKRLKTDRETMLKKINDTNLELTETKSLHKEEIQQ